MTVDELVVELSLDTSKFTEGQKNALTSFRKTQEQFEKGLNDLEAKNKKVGYSFGDAAVAAQGLFGALAGAGMVAFAHETMTAVAAQGRMAANLEVSTNELSAFGRMIERNGGNADTAAGSMKSLTDQVERFKLLGQASNELQLFAGTIGADLNSSAIDVYMKFVEWANKHRDDPKQINVIGQLGGLDQGSISTALKGSVQVLKEYQDALRGSVSPEETRRLTEMQDAWVKLEQQIGDTGRRIESNFAPAITHAITAVSQWDERNLKLADSLGTVLTAIAALSALKPALWVLRLLGIASPTGLAVTAAAAAGAGAVHFLPEGTVKSMNEAHPWLGAIDSFFGLNSNDKPSSGAPSGNGSASSRAMAYFQSQGWSRAQAAGLAANIQGESNFNPNMPGDGGSAYGLAQWHPDRQANFKRQFGKDIKNSSFEEQLQFMQWELTNSESAAGNRLRGASNARDAGDIVSRYYERPLDTEGQAALRGRTAERYNVESMSITVQTDSKNPREHGRIVAEEIKKNLGGSITTQANAGLSN